MTPALVLGIGNTLRSDDGAGVRAAERIGTRFPHIEVETVHQLTPDLAERLHQFGHVMIMDASVRASEVTFTRLGKGAMSAPIRSHGSSPEQLLALCRSLYGKAPDDVVLVEIPAASFEFGETLSPVASRGVEQAIDLAGKYLSGLDL